MSETAGRLLEDGTAPASPQDLLDRLDRLGIEVTTTHHPAVFTVEEAKALRGDIPGCHTKNLFLRNKKGRMWLVVCLESRSIDLKALGATLGAGRFSFGSPDRLMRFLGIIPGAVSPFAVLNDRTGQVQVALDRAVLEEEPLNFHPLDNTMTTSIGGSDFLQFLEAVDHTPQFIDFEASVDAAGA